MNEDYVIQIVCDWNVCVSGFGYVICFVVDEIYVVSFLKKVVGNKIYEEFWVFVEDFEVFNVYIFGLIEVIYLFNL